MAHRYTLVYTCSAINVSAAILAAAWAAIPLPDGGLAAELGLTPVISDVVTTAGDVVTRTTIYNSTPGPLGNPDTLDALTNIYTKSYGEALCTTVEAAPVVFT